MLVYREAHWSDTFASEKNFRSEWLQEPHIFHPFDSDSSCGVILSVHDYVCLRLEALVCVIINSIHLIIARNELQLIVNSKVWKQSKAT